jgi:hypothetical protein
MATRMQQRRGTAQQWTDANPVLAAGEIGFETDTNQFKIGDGVNLWAALSYFKNLEDLGGSLDDYILVTARSAANGVAPLDADGEIPLGFMAKLVDGADANLNTLRELGDVVTLHTAHVNAATSVHGIADTAQLATLSNVESHRTDTTDVHGIVNTALLATTANVSTAKSEAITDAGTAADTKITTHNDDTTGVHGIADTSLLATKSYADTAVDTHNTSTTNVHGIADTTLLATKSYADTAEADAITAAGLAADSKVSAAVAALTKSSVGLGNVDNTADVSKPVSTATQTALDAKLASATAATTYAPIESPTFTGTVSGVTKAHVGLANVDNTADASKPVSTAQATAIATAKSEAIADATSQVNALLTGAPAALNTLDELAAALGDDANFASTVTTSLGLKAPLASPTFTGTVTLPAAGIVFTDGTQAKEGVPSRTPIIQKTDSYTLSALTERDSLIEMGKATAQTVTIPTNASVAYPIGTSIDILQTGAGQVTIAGAGGVTVNSTPGLKLRTQWSSATLFKRAENTWVVFGDLTA